MDTSNLRAGARSRRPRVLAAAGLAAAIFLLGTLHAQTGNGVIEGRLVNGTDRSKATGPVGYDVVTFEGGMSILKSGTTDASGNFKIGSLPTASQMMVQADYKGVNYHSRVAFDPSGHAHVEIEVFEPTTSLQDITPKDVRIAFQLVGDRLRTLESFTFDNHTRPARTFMEAKGTFRFSKPDGILEPPGVHVTGPGSTMPLTQSALESSDGRSYYVQYGLRPGLTVFEVDQILPYSSHSYTLRRTFYNDVASFQVGVIPRDMALEGEGLRKLREDSAGNFAVYEGGPVKAGTELVWRFIGGTPPATAPSEQSVEPRIRPMPNVVGRHSVVIGSVLLLGFVVVLWYAYTYQSRYSASGQDPRSKELKDRREQLLNQLASLEQRYENHQVDRREYVRVKEQGRKQLRRISMLLRK
jgi:hypothetical protein